MEGKNDQQIVSCDYGENAGNVSADDQSHYFASYAEMIEDQAECGLSLSQWLHPSRIPRSYLALLNEDPRSLEYAAVEDVIETIDLPTGGTDVAGVDQKTHAATANGSICSGEASANAFLRKVACKVKPSVRVQSRGNHEPSGSYGKVSADKRPLDKLTHFWSQSHAEKLTIRKEEQNNKDNRDSSQLYRKYRVVRPKQSNITKQKSYSSDRERKLRIADNIKALRELLPNPVEDTPESILNDVVAHVKLLQLQIKELSRSRLGGEPTSHPLISIEGYGHYIHQEQRMNKPLEEMMANLLETDPEATTCLLETKGLYLMPMALADGLCRMP